MKTAFHGEYKLRDNYLDVLPGQSSTLTNGIMLQSSGISLSDIFEIVSTATVNTGFSYSLFGISNAKVALTVSYFIGLGSFIGLIILISLFRGTYLLIRNKRRNRNVNNYTADSQYVEYQNSSANTYTVKSSSSILNNSNLSNSVDHNI